MSHGGGAELNSPGVDPLRDRALPRLGSAGLIGPVQLRVGVLVEPGGEIGTLDALAGGHPRSLDRTGALDASVHRLGHARPVPRPTRYPGRPGACRPRCMPTPVHADPVHADPVHADPVHADPVHAERGAGTARGMDPSSAAVLFDIDGTLVDSTYHHALAWHRALARHDLAPPMAHIHRAIGMGGDRLVGHLTDAEVEEALGDELRGAWRAEYGALRGEVRPLPGARELVVRARERGLRVALASSGDPQFSREAVALLDIDGAIELLTTAEDVDASKPEPDLIWETLRRLDGVDRAIFVGDTVYDVQAAGRAGIACVAVCTGGLGRSELLTAGAVAVADTLVEAGDLSWLRHLRAIDVG